MVKGKSGFMNVLAPWQKAHYKATTREIICYNLDGSQRAVINLYTAEEPDELRGPEHDGFWADELAAWKYADAWDQLNFGLRIGDNPRGIITTTPRPNRMVRALLKDADTVVTRGTTYENAANVNKKWLNQLLKKYEGTTLGRQELEAQVLDEMPGALWTRALLDSTRVASPFADGYLPTYSTWRLCPHPDLMKIVIGVDPAVTAEEGSDETGIGAAGYGENEHGFVLEDATARYKPKEWADKTVELFKRWEADCVVAEVNQGGDLVAQNIHAVDPSVPVVMVHAHKSKYSRAQPIATWYEKGEVHHVGVLEDLEDEQCNFVPGVSKKSPNRLDWSVYALTELMGNDVLTAAPELEGLMQ